LESPADQPVRKLSDYFLQLHPWEREREREPAQHAGSVHKRSTGVYLRAQFPWHYWVWYHHVHKSMPLMIWQRWLAEAFSSVLV
jgi:hypothetical protein